jgi:hypothetical protein
MISRGVRRDSVGTRRLEWVKRLTDESEKGVVHVEQQRTAAASADRDGNDGGRGIPARGRAGSSPGVTTDYDGMTFAGHESTAMLLGVFHVSILHNIVPLLFGVVGAGWSTWCSGSTD